MPNKMEESRCFCVKGTEVLRYRVIVPQWDAYETISEFYREIGARSVRYCEETLRPYAERMYEESEQPDKRFRFPVFFYGLMGRVTYEDEQVASVRLEMQWRRRGDAETAAHGSDGHTWQLREECLLPPRQAFGLWNDRRLPRRQSHSDGIVREGERIWLYRNGESREIAAVSLSSDVLTTERKSKR